MQLIHRGKIKRLTKLQRRWLRRRQAIEPAIGHAKHDYGLQRCWLKGAEGDALHTVLCAAGYNLRWLLRAIARLGIAAVFFPAIPGRHIRWTARHRPQTVCRCGADLVGLVSIVRPGAELLHYCTKTNFAGPTK